MRYGTLLTGVIFASITSAALASADSREDAAFLPMTRAEFVQDMREIAPGMEIPQLRCGAPLALRRCSAETESGLQIHAADTYETEADIAAFHDGAEGKLYYWTITAADTGAEQVAELFVGCTTAVMAARGVDMDAAGDVVAVGFEAAAGDDDRSSVDRTHPSIVVVDILDKPSCTITAQWHK